MLNTLRRISIGARLNVTTALLAAVVALIGATGWWAVDRAQRDFHGFSQQHLPLLLACNRARESLNQLAAFDEIDVVMNYSLPDEARRRAEAGLELLARTRSLLQSMGAPASAPQAASLRLAMDHLAAYATQVEPVFEQAGAGKLASVAAGKHALEGARRRLAEAGLALQELSSGLDLATTDSVDRIAGRNAGGSRMMAVVAPGAILALLAMMRLMRRSLLEPLARARKAATGVATGDLSQAIEDPGRDEIADLMRGLAAMQASLRTTVGAIRDAAVQQATASRQIAAGNRDLSHRTEQMAGGLQDTASGLADLDRALGASTRDAQQAGHQAAQAAQSADEGSAAMQALSRVMHDIEASFVRIAEIVDVVDGIARRTNILALNAGVEAARAGTQGRGFAVVAQEVRALSQQVTESAQQIAGVIRQTTPQVLQALHQVSETNTAMASIQTAARTAAQGTQGIADAVRARSAELAGLNGAMNRLEQLTQQNAALVEQSAAAAHHLSDQAGRLTSLVGTFSLPET